MLWLLHQQPSSMLDMLVSILVSMSIWAREILVLDAGRIVARGTHTELMDSSETYREIVLSQLTEQEAAA